MIMAEIIVVAPLTFSFSMNDFNFSIFHPIIKLFCDKFCLAIR